MCQQLRISHVAICLVLMATDEVVTLPHFTKAVMVDWTLTWTVCTGVHASW